MNKKQGFTVIELIVTVGIIGVIATIMAVQLFDKSPQKELERNVKTAYGNFQLARSYATSTYKCCGATLIYGYGIVTYANTGHYLIYANKSGTDHQYSSATDQIISDYYLDANVKFSTSKDIFFTSSIAATYLNGATAANEIDIELIDRSSSMSIKINPITSTIFYE